MGVGQAFDGGSGIGPIIIGVMLVLLGVVLVRKMSASSDESPIPAPGSLGDHSLTQHHTRDQGSTAQPSHHPGPTPPSPARVSRIRLVEAIVGAIIAVGFGLGVVGVLTSEAPNVPQHVLQACDDSLHQAEGPAASFGKVTAYDAVGVSSQELHFETTQGWTWFCTYDSDAGVAVTSSVSRG